MNHDNQIQNDVTLKKITNLLLKVQEHCKSTYDQFIVNNIAKYKKHYTNSGDLHQIIQILEEISHSIEK